MCTRLSNGIESAKKNKSSEVSSTDFSSNAWPSRISDTSSGERIIIPTAAGMVKNKMR